MPKKFWTFKIAEDSIGELLIYGDISDTSWWGDEVTPKQFKKDLDALGGITQLNVYINSGGGDIFASQAIYSMLTRHSATIHVYIDGLAASGASLIAMAGDKRIMPEGSMLMIHNAWTIVLGNANELREMADKLEKISDSVLLPAYETSGQTREKIKELLDAETWLTAQEALDLGFATEIEEGKKVAASINGDKLSISGNVYDLGRYKNRPHGLVETDPNDGGDELQITEADKLKAEIELLSII